MYHVVTHTDGPIHGTGNEGRDDAEARAQGPSGAGSDAPGAKDSRKERVLHTRVPAVLERQLKRFAESLRIPVSNLVRTILEDALHVADFAERGGLERSSPATKVLSGARKRLKQPSKSGPLEGVVAFQVIVLAQRATCAQCGDSLGRGARAQLAVSEPAHRGENRIVCQACLPIQEGTGPEGTGQAGTGFVLSRRRRAEQET